MSFGCPVVCSEIRSLRERCGDAAAYCDPNDVTSIVDQVTRVLSDQNLALELQQLGLRQAASFTWEQQVNAVIEVLRPA
jgi:glycosyltransferase involved in cell wall biosynthesis